MRTPFKVKPFKNGDCTILGPRQGKGVRHYVRMKSDATLARRAAQEDADFLNYVYALGYRAGRRKSPGPYRGVTHGKA